jgi:hypothetical protein
MTPAPAARESLTVSSVEPSSTTNSSTTSMPGMLRGTRSSTGPIVAASLSAGMMTSRRFLSAGAAGTKATA